jgi:hypothetical protein
MWACPHCRQALRAVYDGKSLACPDGHAFDRAREGYVNLLGDIVGMTPFAHRGHREKRENLLASGLDAVDMAFFLSLFQLGV